VPGLWSRVLRQLGHQGTFLARLGG
jgi:hypothetical protein